MNAKRIASGSVAGSLAMFLLALSPESCATGGSAAVELVDSGTRDAKAAPESDGACGAVDQPCCAPPTQCNPGAFCNPSDICKNQHPSDVGHTCSGPSSCSSGICAYTEGLGDGGPSLPDGSPPPDCPSTGCTVGCSGAAGECLPGWNCSMLTIGEGLCTCTCADEICDGEDNNCDGIIDNEPATDKWCTKQMEGIPSKCVKGGCVCVDTCSDECVDLENDSENCGKCNNACKPVVEKCGKGACVCAFTVCGGECVDTMASDNANCGGCDVTCAYQCTKGVCGPASIPVTDLSSIGPVVVDDTNVYWLGTTSADALEVEYCALTGCTKPTVLAAPSTFFFDTPALGSLALDSTAVYFADDSSDILRCAKPPTGCSSMNPSTYTASADPDQSFVAADTNNVYWANEELETVFDCAAGASCSSAKQLQSLSADGESPQGIAVSSTTIYWAATLESSSSSSTGDLTVFATPIVGGPISTLCTASDVSQVGQIIVAGDFVYFTDGESTVYSCATGTNGATAATYTSVTQPGGLASDGTNLYWAENTSGSSSSSSTTGTGGASILTCALGATCAKPTTVVSGLDAVDGVAVTATTLYWTATDSAFNPELFYFKK